jgi:two-component system, chemotaxis family, chemotaxis protein CheY
MKEPLGPEEKSVLVVEDDVAIRAALCELLEFEGYKVHQATDGKQALETLKRGLRPHLILLDLMMPVMSGSRFREEQMNDPLIAYIPVIVLSADSNIKNVSEKLRIDRFLRKPVNLDELLATIQQSLNA